ncbi:MAG: hypothetical protein ACQEWL_19305 [Pseudomonadota bacterium]
MWWSVAKFVAVIVASYFLSAINAPKQRSSKPEAASSEDWDYPQPKEGTPQCVFFGDCWTDDWFVLAYGNYHYDAIRK